LPSDFHTMAMPTRKPRNMASKRAMLAREPKLVEGERSSLFMRGTSTSEQINAIVSDLHDLKKPNSTYFHRRNEKRPFEDETSVEFLCQKNEASFFSFASHSKKRPNNLILGRTFDYKIYDMYELGLINIKPTTSFKPGKFPSLMNRPCVLFQGDAFETDLKMARIKNLFLDMFSHNSPGKINLAGIEHAIVLTAQGEKVSFKHYRIDLKKSGGRVPRVECEEIGPSFEFEVRRERTPAPELEKAACRKPKQLVKQGKAKKNTQKNALGETLGRVHMQSQSFDDFQTRKVPGLKRGRDKGVALAEEAEAEAKKARLEAGEEE